MSIEFDDGRTQQVYSQIEMGNEVTGMAKFLLDKGIAKTPAQANTVMVVISILSFSAAIFVVFKYIL